MRAAVYHRYGPPEVVHVADLPMPEPLDNEVLIKVHASTVNRTDSGFRSAAYFVSRFWSGLLQPKYPTLGCEFSGVVERIGTKVSLFKPGERIFGFDDHRFGGHAEYLKLPETSAIAKMPESMPYETAAALTEGAHYALCNIRAAGTRKGDHVLVYGATGAIGSAAVQLLHYFGATVTAVCNGKNIALVQSLGANTVIDYETQDFTNTGQQFDLVLDCVGKSSFKICKPLLKSKGKYISTEPGRNGINLFLALYTPLTGGKKVMFPIPVTKKEDIEFLGRLAAESAFTPVIDRRYSLEEIVEAYRYVETGQKTGNVVLQIR